VVLEQFHIRINHQFREVHKLRFRFPAQFLFGFAVVANQEINFGRPVISRIDFDMLFPIKTGMLECNIEKLADGVRFIGRDHIIVRLILLQHHPHGLDIFLRVTPVTLGVQVAEVQLILKTGLDVSDRAGDFARDECFTASW
jgi:hypothetical protein